MIPRHSLRVTTNDVMASGASSSAESTNPSAIFHAMKPAISPMRRSRFPAVVGKRHEDDELSLGREDPKARNHLLAVAQDAL